MNAWKNFVDSLMTKDKMKLPNIAIAMAIGIGLILAANLFGGGEEAVAPDVAPSPPQVGPTGTLPPEGYRHEAYLERRLEGILRTMDGVGQVRVMITLSSRSSRVYAENVVRSEATTSEQDDVGGQRQQQDTQSQQTIVTINGQGGYQQPILVREYEPAVEGVIISAQGAGDPRIRAELLAAAQVALGVDLNSVQVLTMASQ